MRGAFGVIGLCCLVHLADAAEHAAFAQDLPVETYTTADGLPNDVLSRVVQDANGILWIGAHGGLIRFDGEVFTAFGKAEGLDVGTGINAIRFDSRGDLWIGTNGAGIFHFDPATSDRASPFTQLVVGEGRAANRVNVIAFAANGSIWAGTDAGLYTGRRGQAFLRIELPLPAGQSQEMVQVFALVEDGERLWVGTAAEVFRCEVPEAHARRVRGSARSRYCSTRPTTCG